MEQFSEQDTDKKDPFLELNVPGCTAADSYSQEITQILMIKSSEESRAPKKLPVCSQGATDDLFQLDSIKSESTEELEIYKEFPIIIVHKGYIFAKCSIKHLRNLDDPSLPYKSPKFERYFNNGTLTIKQASDKFKVFEKNFQPIELHKIFPGFEFIGQRVTTPMVYLNREKVLKYVTNLFIQRGKCNIRRVFLHLRQKALRKTYLVKNNVNILQILQQVEKELNNAQIVQAEQEQTMELQPFGRKSVLFWNSYLKRPEHALIFYSEFQEYLLQQSVSRQHIQLEVMRHCAPEGYKCIIVLIVCDAITNNFYPAAFAVLKTDTKEAYTEVLTALKKQLKDSLKPRIIVAPYDASLIKSSAAVFPNAQVTTTFVHFVRSLWKEATRLLLKKRNLVKNTKKIINAIKGLTILHPKKVSDKFDALRRKISPLVQKSCSRYGDLLKYIDKTFILTHLSDAEKRGYVNAFPINFWNILRWKKKSKLHTIINMGVEKWHNEQPKIFGFKNPSLDQIISAFRDFDATKKIEFESTPREFSELQDTTIECGSDIVEFEKKVGIETAYCIQSLKEDPRAQNPLCLENPPMYVSDDEDLCNKDEDEEQPIDPKKACVSDSTNFGDKVLASEQKKEAKVILKTPQVKLAEEKETKNVKKMLDKQENDETNDTEEKIEKKRGRKKKFSTDERPENNHSITSFPIAPPPKRLEKLITDDMSIEDLCRKLDIEECLPILQDNKVTVENLKYLEMGDLREMKIPIGPARQIINEIQNNTHRPPVKVIASLPKRKRGPNKIRPQETEFEKKERVKEERKKKRDEKAKAKDHNLENNFEDKLASLVKIKPIEKKRSKSIEEEFKFQGSPSDGNILKHLVKKKRDHIINPPQNEKEDKQKVMEEVTSLISAKPEIKPEVKNDLKPVQEEKEAEQECSSQDSLKSDEPFL
ncbi:unnamed protein product [Moneuplotes crassus]|uniref:MULE transposase domain-containing protein n=1 Tax=Euplotes crassus TaxID=5936 RepID=A0AAD1Y093_EUPCR|nr:unnamed protein product [Moneuplotes crassus]